MTVLVPPESFAAPGMPPLQPRAMPTQDLRVAPGRALRPLSLRVYGARVVAFGGAAGLAGVGAYEMISVVSAGGITQFEALFTVLFVINFTWIAFAATSALAGVMFPPAVRLLSADSVRLTKRTALVMPVYHESPAETAAALEVMAKGLVAAGHGHAFEVVVLSDSTNADSWLAETRAVEELRRTLGESMPVWYRRRWKNTGKKAGNIRDFIEHWGARYDHFVVLDADSLISPATLVGLAAAMEADRGLGLLQTAPALAGGQTLFARLQQFANRVFGPPVTRGLAAWAGSDGNYWGHNAIIRTKAFAACCGLPDLPGAAPLGGSIMSHDFVEAALLRRAGWRVEMATALFGSWEGAPPSLIDTAARDRRWAQGNLQHIKVITARGLAWPSRLHLAVGIMSYIASPLWLVLILSGVVLTVQADVIQPQYFPKSFQLFPEWPLFDSERMLRLFLFTVAVLFTPKVIGLIAALASPELRRGCGGALRLVTSALAEVVLTALYAPVMMAIHTRHVADVLFGRDSDWKAQRRDGATTWAEAWRRHRGHMAFGVVGAVGAWFVSPAFLAWLSPMVAGFLLVVPLSYASGSPRVGQALRRAGLLLTPEETTPDAILSERDETVRHYPERTADSLRVLATDPAVRDVHFRWVNPPMRRRGSPVPELLTARTKLAEATSFDEALAWLAPAERVHVAGDPELIAAAAALARVETAGRQRHVVTPAPAGAQAEVFRQPVTAEAAS